MNRGKGRQEIFHSQAYYDEFSHALEEAHGRFGVEIQGKKVKYNIYLYIFSQP